jgi:tRNA threonylcarbamoyladenosine biosynthesis protein TsaB
MILLAIDTSTEMTGLALWGERGLVAECNWFSGRNHAAQLLPQLDLLLAHTATPRAALGAVAVALGPGSWSGLRVGLSTAKGLALAGDLALIGVPTLEIVVRQFAGAGLPLVPIFRLGRDRVALRDARGELINLAVSDLAAHVGGPALFCGEIDAQLAAQIIAAVGANAHMPPPLARVRRAAVLAQIGWERWQAGATDAAAAIEPIYLGQPVRGMAETGVHG